MDDSGMNDVLAEHYRRYPAVESSDSEENITRTWETTIKKRQSVESQGIPGKVPKSIYRFIQEALAIRKHLETHKDDNKAKTKLLFLEGKIDFVVSYHKDNKNLPLDFIYDPNTAITLEPMECLRPYQVSTDFSASSPDQHGHACIKPRLDPDKELPNTDDVPFKDNVKKIWLRFKKYDKKTPEEDSISIMFFEKQQRPLSSHPIVTVIGQFAVSAYNEACQMHVKKNVPNNLNDYTIMDCKYIKMIGTYYFYLTIEATEEEALGVYEAKVICDSDEDKLTLSRFVLTDRTPAGKKRKRSAICHEKIKTDPGCWCNPEDDDYSGMVCRIKGTTCPGYDYYTPFVGYDGP